MLWKMKPIKKTKVIVAMSGGVDSSVAALLMKKQGFDVIGVFMKNWSDSKNEIGECNWKDERKYAIQIAHKLKIPLITLDFEKQYKKEVIEKMFHDYYSGKTPNPDIDCNYKIKFPLLLRTAKKLNAEYLVTGHYARIRKDKKGKFELFRAKDESKDQSYFLYRTKQNELKKLIFPIGDYTKKQVREIAKKENFPNFDKKSTVGICFVGKVNMKKFLQKKIKAKPGKILNHEGKVIGEHDGIYYYTIGQRLGEKNGIKILKNSDNGSIKKWYVAKKDSKKNIIIAAPEGHKLLCRKEIFIKNPFWINKDEVEKLVGKKVNNKIKSIVYSDKKEGWMVGAVEGGTNFKDSKLHARIRQLGKLIPVKIFRTPTARKFRVSLNKPVIGIANGQAIVLYKGEKVLGGEEIAFE